MATTALRPVTIVLMGEPVPFARMRIGSGGIHYIPSRQRNTAAALRMAAQQAMAEQGAAAFDCPLLLELHAEFRVPASWSKNKRATAIVGDIRPAKRPDLDNLLKLAADALNTVVYRDDAQIVDARLRKVYGEQPKLVVTVGPAA